MYFKRWKQSREKRRFKTDSESNSYQELLSKVYHLEKELSLIKQWQESGKNDAPIIIENIHIENFKVDKIDHENNFGSLGIKDLAGQLNIGANYQTGIPKQGGDIKKKNPEPEHPPRNTNEGPHYTLKAKKIE